MSFIQELKRRNVFKVGIAYAVTTWILLQLTDVLSEMLTLPAWAPKLILVILVVGFVPALIFAWAFELTPEGVKRERDVDRSQSIVSTTGKKLNRVIFVLMALAIAYLLYDKFATKEPLAVAAPAAPAVADVAARKATSPPAEPSQQQLSIAVLPFVNRSPKPEDAYFTDGIHDDLLTQLAKIKAFSVISRTSVMEYRNTVKNLKQIGRELGVSDIMEGSVQRAGDRVRINVQLINADSDKHLWAEIYDRQLTTDNLFDIQSEIARAIAQTLHAKLTDDEAASVAQAPTANVNAYELYLQARRFTLGETRISYQTAIDLYKEALALDPGFKLAWIGLAKAHITNYWSYGGDPGDRELARQAIDKARAIDPDFPELYMAEGFYHYWGRLDYAKAIEYLDKAIALMPGNAEAWMWKGWATRRAGRWEDAIAAMREALRLDPRVLLNWTELSTTYLYLHDYENASIANARAGAIDADDFWYKTVQAKLELMEHGDTERAMTLTLGAQHTSEIDFYDPYIYVRTLAERYREALEVATADWPQEREIRRQSIVLGEDLQAQLYRFMGDQRTAREAAVTALERLKTLAAQLGDDYRLYLPRARMYAILGEPGQVRAMIKRSIEASPRDAVEEMSRRQEYARCYALAGLAGDAVAMLEPLLSPPSDTSLAEVRLDPAFEGIRESAEFKAMLERHP